MTPTQANRPFADSAYARADARRHWLPSPVRMPAALNFQGSYKPPPTTDVDVLVDAADVLSFSPEVLFTDARFPFTNIIGMPNLALPLTFQHFLARERFRLSSTDLLCLSPSLCISSCIVPMQLKPASLGDCAPSFDELALDDLASATPDFLPASVTPSYSPFTNEVYLLLK
ncbi:UNVERIFIED_CONTAM: hypothetical protein Sangu_0182900 [Sesamum angustifolium]|uniref:Uncharacterized protein n=1 Tax=Sesamum angustifolium TaxID=2727405 RepID=A0AAW2RLZ6_9LAMI